MENVKNEINLKSLNSTKWNQRRSRSSPGNSESMVTVLVVTETRKKPITCLKIEGSNFKDLLWNATGSDVLGGNFEFNLSLPGL